MNEKMNTVPEDPGKELSIDDLDQINGGSPTVNTNTISADRAGGHTASSAINAYLQN